MDNDLMARRLRPPAEPSRPSSPSGLPFIPAPSALPWETETRPPAAAREEIPWDVPAAEAWPPDPAVEEAAVASWPSTPAPTEAAEPAPQPREAAQTVFEAAEFKPAQVDASPADQSLFWQPAVDSPPDVDSQATTDSAAAPEAPEASEAPEVPWDRPSNDDFDQPMDAHADGPSWDEPAAFEYDDAGIFDDRPSEMLEAFHSPTAVAVQERPAEAVATTTFEVDTAADVAADTATDAPAGDPYDEAAPVVADVAERLTVPAWPSWNGHDSANGHEAGNGNESANGVADEPLVEMSALGQEETSKPEPSAFVPWDESPSDEAEEETAGDSSSAMLAPMMPDAVMPEPVMPEPVMTESVAGSVMPEPVMPESVAGSVGPTADDLFASPPVSEDELPEPDDVAPWDFDAEDDEPELFENEVSAPVAEDDPFEVWQAMAVASFTDEPETSNETVAFAETDAALAETDAAVAEADAAVAEADAAESEAEEVSAEPDALAESEPEVEASVEAPPEAETTTLPIDIPAPSAFPATIYASGPESGLPANVVLRIELSIVDDAKRLNVTNVASASEFAPRADGSAPAPVEEVASAEAEDSAWPAIWDPDRDSTGVATLDAAAMATYQPATSGESWPELDRPQDPFGQLPAAAVPLVADGAPASGVAVQTASPRISTIAEPQSDLWFQSAEPATPADPEAADASETATKPGMSLLTVGLTVGMAILVIVLVLVFIQLMTSLLG